MGMVHTIPDIQQIAGLSSTAFKLHFIHLLAKLKLTLKALWHKG